MASNQHEKVHVIIFRKVETIGDIWESGVIKLGVGGYKESGLEENESSR